MVLQSRLGGQVAKALLAWRILGEGAPLAWNRLRLQHQRVCSSQLVVSASLSAPSNCPTLEKLTAASLVGLCFLFVFSVTCRRWIAALDAGYTGCWFLAAGSGAGAAVAGVELRKLVVVLRGKFFLLSWC